MVSRLECANAIRFLSMDAVQKANSGHPGMPMGMADIAEVLWRDYLNINPVNTKWFNRDRFVLSNGHGAMLLYSLLHLTGFDLSLDDLKNFRQFHSKTPGHPEHADTPGVETTTGPLGQGLANAVGMAIAEKALAHQFNRDSFPIVDHYTYAFIGDGCLMEGISHEVCSLAGTLGLGKLIVLWDDNGISIDGDVAGWFTDNTPKRFAAYEWHVVADVDGHDSEAVSKAIALAKENTDKPSIICCRTKIGFGAPTKEGTASTHGAPLGDEEIAATRKALGWEHGSFEIPESIYAAWDKRQAGQELENKWNKLFAQYERANPALATEFLRRQHGDLPEAWYDKAEDFTREVQQAAKANATRKDSLLTLNAFVPLLPEMLGGSADLSGSNLTAWSGASAISKDNPGGDYIHYGVREFGMAAIMNGIALHGGFIPFGGTFLVFADYARNAIRLSALMKQRVIYVLTHDSIGLGEDGPTHQPIEHASMLRITPQVNVWRPCDGVETAVAWQHGLTHQGPSCLLLTRQGVPVQPRTEAAIENIRRGGYVLWESSTDAVDGIIIATGSEVQLAVEAARQLETQGIHMRVVSMPCCELFKSQSVKYQEMILPSAIKKRLAIEAGTSDYWRQFVGIDGRVIGLDSFGMSAPAKEIFAARGFTVSNVIEEIQEMLALQSVH